MIGSHPKGTAPIGRTQYCQVEGWVEGADACFLVVFGLFFDRFGVLTWRLDTMEGRTDCAFFTQ
jgi:hypothetical protein